MGHPGRHGRLRRGGLGDGAPRVHRGAGNLADPAARERFEALVDTLFATGVIVYKGYVDDPRNTDHAWMETMAYHFHCTPELGALLPLASGDDAADVMWLDIDSANYRWATLYASHKEIVQKAVNRLDRSTSANEDLEE